MAEADERMDVIHEDSIEENGSESEYEYHETETEVLLSSVHIYSG